MSKLFLVVLIFFIYPSLALAEEEGSLLSAPSLAYKLICGSKPQAVFSWNQISGANIYRLYTIKGQNFTPTEVTGTETTVNLSSNEDFKYTVEAMVKENGQVVREGKWSNEVLIKGDTVAKECGFTNGEEKEDEDNGKTSELKEDGKEEKVEKPKVQVIEKVVTDSGKNLELEEKVGKLSQELEQAKQRQNALEQLIQNLLTILKNIFKFSF